MPSYVLDTTSIVATLYREEGGDQVRGLLRTAAGHESGTRTHIFLPFMALMETRHIVTRREGPLGADQALIVITQWPAEVRESNPAWRDEAARVKALGGLSVADAWIAALALIEDAKLVHKDPEYDRVPDLKAHRLPYRQRRG
ncbi:MAG: type II toxin-antitoxin system VapC family toxin [Dehalococcoidia bacterium]|nr:type II toxin-antitoxin system VapC family toxin [Dehalococcoidia bacterium]